MDKIEGDNYTTRIWNTKHISEPDSEWYIIKVFKTRRQMLPIDQQRDLIAKKMQYFGEYIPKTELVEFENWEYYIKQKYINWKTLAETDISNLSAKTLWNLIDLIKKYLKYYGEQWWELDLTWYQYYWWNPSPLKRKLLNFLKINENFLTSTNIMISDDWSVFMIDVCESADSRLQWKIKNFCAKPFIKRTISKLEEALQKRINFENESINTELLGTLTE